MDVLLLFFRWLVYMEDTDLASCTRHYALRTARKRQGKLEGVLTNFRLTLFPGNCFRFESRQYSAIDRQTHAGGGR